MDAPAMVITLAVVLCTPLPHARSVKYIRRTLAGGGCGRTETDQGFYSLMVAPSEVPRNAEVAQGEGRVVEEAVKLEATRPTMQAL
jgi:hypothetical protein